ncbi:hypothetical protein [Aeromicrobium sp.]|uniref:hypothetical protein n=1 Tax=Aeromicrobium sp. TaxID=1871063 RepID=UPI003C374BF1
MKAHSRHLPAVLLILVLAPVTAEYLIGYDDTVGKPAALLFGVLFFAPLYGAPAVLIREVARRRGLGWPTILVLATAFGLIEAGLIDQSLFDPDYREIPYWQAMRAPTYLPWFGMSAYMALIFVAGHVFGSIAAPIALAESWWPARRDEPWLGPVGLVVVALMWAAGAAFILQDQLSGTSFRVSAGQVAGTVVVVVALIAAAVTLKRPAPSSGRAPVPWVVAVVTAVLLTVRSIVPTSWWATILALAAIVVWLVLMRRWSRRSGWGGVHVLAAAVGVLLSIGGPAFTTTPLGDVPLAAKLATNVVLLALVLAVAAVGYRRISAATASARPASASPRR